jgi:hypothetical protein
MRRTLGAGRNRKREVNQAARARIERSRPVRLLTQTLECVPQLGMFAGDV